MIDRQRSNEDMRGVHLFVFVHGLSGNIYDLRLLKDFMQAQYRDYEYLICGSIQVGEMKDVLLTLIRGKRWDASRVWERRSQTRYYLT